MKIGSLFSGIGGLELGLEWAGVGETVWQVEIDPFCRAVLARHWPDVKRYEDVKTVGAHNLEPVDVICGGYPCQPFSQAGNRCGIDDERHLWPEYARIIRELRPRFAVLENVPAHLSLGFGDVLGDLAELGYDAEWSVLRADQCGIPQARPRIFLIATPTSRSGEAVFPYNPLDVIRAHPWVDGACRATANVNYENRGAGSVSVLGDADRSQVPNRERSGTDERLSGGMDRYRVLGNAVVPQVAEVVGRRLLAIDQMLRATP